MKIFIEHLAKGLRRSLIIWQTDTIRNIKAKIINEFNLNYKISHITLLFCAVIMKLKKKK